MVIVRIPIGGRVFAPSWLMTALTAALCVGFVALGRWQWDRGVRRQAQWDAFARGADAPLGYVRDWQPPGLPPIRHFSYAVQWWGFAVTLVVIWVILSAPKRPARTQDSDSRASSS